MKIRSCKFVLYWLIFLFCHSEGFLKFIYSCSPRPSKSPSNLTQHSRSSDLHTGWRFQLVHVGGSLAKCTLHLFSAVWPWTSQNLCFLSSKWWTVIPTPQNYLHQQYEPPREGLLYSLYLVNIHFIFFPKIYIKKKFNPALLRESLDFLKVLFKFLRLPRIWDLLNKLYKICMLNHSLSIKKSYARIFHSMWRCLWYIFLKSGYIMNANICQPKRVCMKDYTPKC